MARSSTIQTQKLLTRKEAADMLGISLRTLDRYIQKKLISIKHDQRSIYLYQEEIAGLVQKHRAEGNDSSREYFEPSAVNLEFQEEAFDHATIDQETLHQKAIMADSSITNFDFKKEANIYRELYFDLKNEVREFQGRLETANYRVGQLETQLKSTVPLIELSHKEKEVEKKERQYQEKQKESSEAIHKLEETLQQEKSSKTLYLILLIGLLLLEPLLLLLEYIAWNPF